MSEKELRSEKFTLLDENGVARAMLTTAQGLVSLALSDGQGNIRAVLSVTANGDPCWRYMTAPVISGRCSMWGRAAMAPPRSGYMTNKNAGGCCLT
jgi:hypothetical protein